MSHTTAMQRRLTHKPPSTEQARAGSQARALSTPLARLGAMSQTRAAVEVARQSVLMATKSSSRVKRSRRCCHSQARLLPIASASSIASFCTKAGSAMSRPTMSRATCIQV